MCQISKRFMWEYEIVFQKSRLPFGFDFSLEIDSANWKFYGFKMNNVNINISDYGGLIKGRKKKRKRG